MHRPMLRDIPLVALLGLLGFAFSNIALNVGEQSIPSGPAAIIFLGERLQAWGWIGIAVSFGGALVIALGKGSG
jgi:drug/metabolite transporter (DMT)-like permease